MIALAWGSGFATAGAMFAMIDGAWLMGGIFAVMALLVGTLAVRENRP